MYHNQPYQNQQMNPYNLQYDIHPNYVSYREVIIKTLMEIIQSTSATTPLRQWFYGVVSNNGWCNQDFVETVNITFKYLVMTDIGDPNASRRNDFVWSVCNSGIGLAAPYVLTQYPNEANKLRQFQANNTANLQILHTLLNDYALFINGSMNQGYGYPNNQMAVAGGFIPNNQPQYNAHQQYQYPNPMTHQQYSNRSPSLSNNQYANPSINPPSNHQVISRFGNIELPDPVTYEEPSLPKMSSYFPQHQAMPPTTNAEPEQPAVEYVTEKDWVSTPEQPYKTLCTSKQKAVYMRINGIVIEKIIDRPEMERDQHAGKIKVCGIVIEPPNRDKLIKDVEAYCQITAEDIAERFANKPRKDILDSVKESVAEEGLQVPYLDAAITYGQIEQKNREEIEGTNVFKMYATVVKPVVTNIVEDNETIARINECKDIPDVVKVLREQTTRTIAEDDNVPNTLYCNEIDKTLANIINTFVVHSLSVNTRIDSFVEDIYELLEYLKKDRGALYNEAMNRFRREVFGKGPFHNIPKDELDSIRGSLFNGVETEDTDTTISFIPTQYSLTYVSSSADELDMYIDKDSKLISELSLPVLYGLAKSSFDHAHGLPTTVLRHLLITRDNRVFEFHKGYLNEGSYLIREFTEKVDIGV